MTVVPRWNVSSFSTLHTPCFSASCTSPTMSRFHQQPQSRAWLAARQSRYHVTGEYLPARPCSSSSTWRDLAFFSRSVVDIKPLAGRASCLAIGRTNADHFLEGLLRLFDRAQPKRVDHRVEAADIKRQRLACGAHHGDVRQRLGQIGFALQLLLQLLLFW